MFGKPKRAKAVAKPRSAEEATAVRRALAKKYPDMVNKTGAWAKPAKAEVKTNARTKGVEGALRNSGMTEEEIKKLRGG